MKIRYIKYWAFAAVLGMGTVSCEDFLNRPTEDNYNESNFYQNDEQCVQGVNYLYNSPWYDFQRGFIKVGEILSGNVYEGNSPYLNFTVNGTDENLVNMSLFSMGSDWPCQYCIYSFEDGKCVRSSEKSVYGRVSGMESHGLLLFGT